MIGKGGGSGAASTPSGPGVDLAQAERDARTLFDIAQIRAQAPDATREDVDFLRIARRNLDAVGQLVDAAGNSAEPTEAMLQAGLEACPMFSIPGKGRRESLDTGKLAAIYQAMDQARAEGLRHAPAKPVPDTPRP